MKKILYNQGFFNNPDIIESLNYLYKIYINLDKNDDITRAINFSTKVYKSDLFFPDSEDILQKIKDFEFDKEVFESEKSFLSNIKSKTKEFRDSYRIILIQKYSDPSNTYEKRTKYIEELTALEAELIPTSKNNVTNASQLSLKENYELRKNKNPGIKTNIDEIDEKTLGISLGKILVVFAAPGNGKTMYAINMTYNNQFIPDNNSLFITLEIPESELKMKLVCRHTYGTSDYFSILNAIKGKLGPEEERIMLKYEEDMDTKRQSKLLFLDVDKMKMDSLFSFKNQLISLIEEHDLKTIYIDYIQLFKEFKPKNILDEKEFLNMIVSIIRHISVSKNVTFIILSQCNREGIKRGQSTEGYYSIHNLSEINSLERHAYYIVSLFTNDELKQENNLKFQLLKHRDGECIEEPMKTYFDPRYFYIGNVLGATKALFNNQDNENSKEVLQDLNQSINDQFEAFFGN
jgi:replicative DNA helicase